jgi:hypothetical protein
VSGRIDARTAPCQVLAGGRLCGKTEDRPIVCHPQLGWICLTHHLVPVTPPKDPHHPKESPDAR